MAAAFSKILIPVDFSQNTRLAVTKAASLVGQEGATIQLLHILKPQKRSKAGYNTWAAEKELTRWKDFLVESNPDITVKTNILKGRSIQQLIIECAAMLAPDLIILGKEGGPRKPWSSGTKVSPSIIARQTKCPVWTAKPGSQDKKTRIIVIPIQNILPERKLEWAVLLAKKFKARIHLLAIQDNTSTKESGLPQAFLKAYHHLRQQLHHPIEYTTITRLSPARAALQCAERIMADMILVHPSTESGVSGWIRSRHISDLLTRDSKIQILDVEP